MRSVDEEAGEGSVTYFDQASESPAQTRGWFIQAPKGENQPVSTVVIYLTWTLHGDSDRKNHYVLRKTKRPRSGAKGPIMC